MSEYGIEITNNDGYLMIDGNYTNYSLYESGTTIVSGGVNVIEFTGTENNPIFVFTPSTSGIAVFHAMTKSGSNFTGAYIGCACTDGNTNFELPWKVFTSSHTSSDDYGLEIYNTNSELVYSSGWELMEIVNFYSPGVSEDAVFTVSGSNNYFFMDGYFGYYSAVYGGGIAQMDVYLYGIKKYSETELQYKKVIVHTEIWDSPYSGSFNGSHTGSPGTILEIK